LGVGVVEGEAGDLFIEIKVQEHPIFVRDGFDIHVMVRCSLRISVFRVRSKGGLRVVRS
jgi:DnaJ-class molecular chaperone